MRRPGWLCGRGGCVAGVAVWQGWLCGRGGCVAGVAVWPEWLCGWGGCVVGVAVRPLCETWILFKIHKTLLRQHVI